MITFAFSFSEKSSMPNIDRTCDPLERGSAEPIKSKHPRAVCSVQSYNSASPETARRHGRRRHAPALDSARDRPTTTAHEQPWRHRRDHARGAEDGAG